MSVTIKDIARSVHNEVTDRRSNLNTRSFRWQGITSVVRSNSVYQVAPFWDHNGNLNIAIRQDRGDWTAHSYDDIGVSLADNHYIVTCGIDPNGKIHVVYDTRNSPLLYRMSANAVDGFAADGSLTAEKSMTGSNESEMNYPTFVTDPAGNLYFMFRDGGSGTGDLYFYAYDESGDSWAGASGTGTGGLLIQEPSDAASPYWTPPAFDEDFASSGVMHFAWIWREPGGGANNKDPSYFKWTGSAFQQSDGTAQTVPITTSNAEKIETVTTGSGLSGFNGADSDSDGNPHIAYQRDDASGDNQLLHAHHNGTSWTVTQVSTGTGRDLTDWSRVSVAVDRTTDTAYIFVRDGSVGDGLFAYVSDPGDFTTWTRERITSRDVETSAPVFDLYEWRENKRLDFITTTFEGPVEPTSSPWSGPAKTGRLA